MKKFTLFFSALLFSMMSFAATTVTFTAGSDRGNAGIDSNSAAAYEVTKDGVTIAVSQGIIGTYNNVDHYRIYKNQTLTVTSTIGNITSIQVTCTANDDAKYGPGSFTAAEGNYAYSGAVGTWIGSAAEVVLAASNNQVRTTEIVVTIDGEGGGETPDTPTGTEITGLKHADAIFIADAEYGDYWVFDLYNDWDEEAGDYVYPDLYVMVNESYSKTAINGTYNVLYTEYLPTANDSIVTDEYAEDFVGSLTIKNVDNNGNYSFTGSFTTIDGTTYTYDQVVNVVAYEYIYDETTGEGYYEDLILSESDTPDTPDTPDPGTPSGTVTFDADVDLGNASTETASAYEVTKSGVTMAVTSGLIGNYQEENHYRIYKNQTLTITSTVGNIAKIEFTCTANDDTKYGPGCFAVEGNYSYSGAVGTWTGDATEVVFTASTNQVRATQIVVTIAGTSTDVEDVLVGEEPMKVIKNGQLFIKQGNKVYTILGAQVK